MVTGLSKKYDRLEVSRKALLTALDQLTVRQLNYKPSEKEWSISQVIAHLVNAETLSTHYMKKKILEETVLEENNLKNKFKSLLLKLLLRSGLKFKAPSVVAHVPADPDYRELKKEWNDARRELKELLGTITPGLLNKNVFKHPRTGYMNITQAIDFMQSHFDHHLPQIKRLKTKNQF